MATYTTNYNLKKPDNTDPFGDFREDYNGNLDIIDANLGGGGGSGGHTIINQSGNAMPSRTGLQFIGASVTDDSVNNKTVVTVTGGGGGHNYSTTEQVIGTWENGKPLYEIVVKNLSIALNGDNWVYYNDPTNIDEVINLECYSDNGGKLLHCAISEYRVSTTNGVQFSGFNGMNRTVNEMIIRYTKTTD